MTGDDPAVDRAALFAALFEAGPDALLVVDAAGRIAMANAHASDLLGYDPGRLRGLSVDALVPDRVRPHHARFREGYAQAPRARPMGSQLELVARRADGSELLVEIALVPLQPHGLPHTLAAIRAIAEYPRVKQALKRARYAECVAQMGRLAVDARDAAALLGQMAEAVAQVLGAATVALHVPEPDGRHLRVVAGAGLLPDEPVGTRVANSPDTPAGSVVAAGTPVWVTDLHSQARFAPPASHVPAGPVSTAGVPVSQSGRLVCALSVHWREARRIDDEDSEFLSSLASLMATVLQRSAGDEALRHAQRLDAVGQLSGGIAHDFNNLLTVIQGNLQVLADRPALHGDRDAGEMVEAAARAVRRGAELTAKLLAFSRRQVLRPRAVRPAAALASLAALLRRTLDQRVRIEVDVAADCPDCLVDAGQLEAALLNVAINARDAMPDGGTLHFGARRCTAADAAGSLTPAAAQRWDGDGVAWSVRDTGTGMDGSVLARAFEPFFTTKDAGRGTGLGLATVHGFAHQSHGAVRLDSAVGAGTTVTLLLPGLASTPAAVAPPKDTPAAPPAGLRVLLVEDEPEVLAVVRQFLAGWGCEVVACRQAQAALDILASPSQRVDLLLSDVVLGPGLRGHELAQRALVDRPGLPVVLMTGYAGDVRAATPWPLLRKPFTREQLAQAIGAVLAR